MTLREQLESLAAEWERTAVETEVRADELAHLATEQQDDGLGVAATALAATAGAIKGAAARVRKMLAGGAP